MGNSAAIISRHYRRGDAADRSNCVVYDPAVSGRRGEDSAHGLGAKAAVIVRIGFIEKHLKRNGATLLPGES